LIEQYGRVKGPSLHFGLEWRFTILVAGHLQTSPTAALHVTYGRMNKAWTQVACGRANALCALFIR
jgi:hypothetical protein